MLNGKIGRLTLPAGLLTLLAFALLFTGCSFLNEILELSNVDTASVAKKISNSDYTSIDSTTYTVPSDKAGKVAYLVKVNLGSSKASASSTGASRALAAGAEDQISSENEERALGSRSFSLPADFTFESLGYELSPSEAEERSSRALKSSYSVGATEKFHINRSSSLTSATLKYISDSFYIWYVPSSKTFIKESQMDFATLGEKLDSVFSVEKEIFGSNVPVKKYSNMISITESDKIHVIVYDIDNDATENKKSGTYGFMDTVNVYTTDSELGKKYNSNGAQILYIDSYFLQVAKEKTWGTAAHELQHLLGFIQKQINVQYDFSTWFTEMLSVLSEEIFQDILAIPDDCTPISLRSDYSGSAYNWGIADECWNLADSTGMGGSFEYVNTYLFGSYLARYYGGMKLINEIATNAYGKEEAISKALASLGYSEDFYQVLGKFPQIYVNASGNNSRLCTLNKAVTSTYKGTSYKLKAIDLTSYKISASYYSTPASSHGWKELVSGDYIPGISAMYKSPGTYVSLPVILKGSSAGQVNLFQYGSSVHCLGSVTAGKKLNFTLPSDKYVAMFITYMGQ